MQFHLFSIGCIIEISKKIYRIAVNEKPKGGKMKKNIFRLCSLVLVVFLLLFPASGCNGEKVTEKYYDDFFGSSVTAVVKGENLSAINAAWKNACEYLDKLKSKISADNAESDVSEFNRASFGDETEIDKITYDVLNKAKAAYKKTNGYFDPTVAMSSDLFGFTSRFKLDSYIPSTDYDRNQNKNGGFELPEEEYVSAFKDLANFERVLISSHDKKFAIKKDCNPVTVEGKSYEQNIDLSGIIKGFAADGVKKIFDEQNLKSYYLSFGSSSLYLGENSQNSWNLKITDPLSKLRASLGSVKIKNRFVSTAGVYERNYTTESGVFCHHIIDPHTGRPAETDILSVTIIGGECADSDALSTSLVALGAKKAIAFAKENNELDYIIVTGDKKIYTTLQLVLASNSTYTIVAF